MFREDGPFPIEGSAHEVTAMYFPIPTSRTRVFEPHSTNCELPFTWLLGGVCTRDVTVRHAFVIADAQRPRRSASLVMALLAGSWNT